MKVNLNLNRLNSGRNVKFEGYKPVKSDTGNREYDFNYVYDDDRKDCYLEIFLLDMDDNGNWRVAGKKDSNGNVKPLKNINNEGAILLEKGKATRINLAKEYGIRPDQPFAYHYKLVPKGQKDGTPEYKIDPGNIINEAASSGKAHEIYNFVTDRLSTATKSGSMKLIVPDFNNVRWVYDEKNEIVPNKDFERAKKTNKNIANKIGGSLAGIEKDLEEGKLDNFTRIITTPLFTDDSLSAHAYWNKNNFQMAHGLGNINNYASLQRKLFAKGINLVSDGAYVNEGLEGVHFRHVLQWGEKSPYFNWFKISGLQDSPLSMGVFGKKLNHVTHRIVNSRYNYKQNPDGTIKISDNGNYKSNEPTYIQIYDDRLVDAEKLNDRQLIRAYDKLLKNNLEISNHNDTVVPYSFKINNETYKKNVKLLSEYNKNVSADKKYMLKSGEGTRAVTQFEYFGLDGKHESGFETWDANPDIAKLSFVQSHSETQDLKNIKNSNDRAKRKEFLKQKNMEVQDYAISSAKFWTKKTNQILTLNAAQHLKNIDEKNAAEIYNKIKLLSNGEVFPKDLDVNEKMVKNVLRNRYNLSKPETDDNYQNAILQGLMDVPLDSIEVGDDIISVLASPYITKRATKPEQIGVSRYEIYKNGNKHLTDEYKKTYTMTDELYKNEMSRFASKILDDVEKKLPADKKFHDNKGNTTEFGKYVLPFLTAEIVKFAIIKGVAPDAKFMYNEKNGEISYEYDKLKSTTSLIKMGIIADCPEDEAVLLIKHLKRKINNIKDTENLKKALELSIQGTSAKSFKLAELVVDRAQGGLDWRIDATKDIADIEALRNGKTNFEYTWNQIINFWAKFGENVKQYHPDAYIAAEVTDEDDIFGKGNGGGKRFSNSKEAVKKLINEAGFTTTANYTYLSSGINEIFGKLFDYDGENSPDKGLEKGGKVTEQLAGFLTSGPLESIIYSYIFAGNHDKCRALDGYATDMDMVYGDLIEGDYDLKLRAYKILHGMKFGKEPSSDEVNNYDFSRISPLAIAKCEAIASGMGKAKNKIGVDDGRAEHFYDLMLRALANISNSKHLGKVIEAEGFGTKDYPTALDIVLDEMNYIAGNEGDGKGKLSSDERQKLKKKSLECIIDPAMSKLLGHTKFLAALTGNPTLYAGDEYGATGFEHTTKNITVQNRNIIHEEWIEDGNPEYMEFVKNFKNHIDYQYNLRKRPELQPLNDGTPFVLNKQKAKSNGKEVEVSALLRQSPDGRMTVSVFNTEGLTHKYDEYYSPAEITLDCIDLNGGSAMKEMQNGGLKSGLEFKDAVTGNSYWVNDKNQITGADGNKITINDSVMTLYLAKKEPSFTGRMVMYNPQYNFVSNPYAQKQKMISGSKLSLANV